MSEAQPLVPVRLRLPSHVMCKPTRCAKPHAYSPKRACASSPGHQVSARPPSDTCSCYRQSRCGCEPFEIVSNIEEAWRLHKPAEPQVFFFDDFLGRTRLFDGASSDPRTLTRFINEIAREDNKRLIVTTRQYILQDARRVVEDLGRHDFKTHRSLLTLEQYGELERARIFYNHIWASKHLGLEVGSASSKTEAIAKL